MEGEHTGTPACEMTGGRGPSGQPDGRPPRHWRCCWDSWITPRMPEPREPVPPDAARWGFGLERLNPAGFRLVMSENWPGWGSMGLEPRGSLGPRAYGPCTVEGAFQAGESMAVKTAGADDTPVYWHSHLPGCLHARLPAGMRTCPPACLHARLTTHYPLP